MASTFLGYWLMGVLMIAVGLVASMLSSNATVAFILGALFCAVPVLLWMVGTAFGPGVRRAIDDLSIPAQFRDFGTGVIPASGLFYFVTAGRGDALPEHDPDRPPPLGRRRAEPNGLAGALDWSGSWPWSWP